MRTKNYGSMWMLGMLLAACDGQAAAEGSGSSGPGGSEDAVCYQGYERCPCMAGACLEGLVCLSDLCVTPEEAGSSGVMLDSSGGELESSSAGAVDSSSSAAGDDTSSSSSDAESSSGTTMLEPECLEEDNYCDHGDFRTCVAGQWQYSSCEEICLQTGYLADNCASADACLCVGFADPVCDIAAYNICVCADIHFDIPCTPEQEIIFYDQCFTEVNEYVECFADFTIDSEAACTAAESVCL